MTIINTSPDRIIQLGYEGEDRVTVLRFRYGADWLENGEGVFNIRVRRHGEHTAYNAALVADDVENNCLLMTVTNTELSIKGAGEMQVVYSGADFVKKSPIYSYSVSRAVDEAVDPPAQDVYTQIIESLSDLQTDVQGLTDAVEGIGNLADLTTTAKNDLVSAINEVNSKSVDDVLSATSTNPVQNKVLTARINSLDSDVGTLRTSVQSKADIQTVSALADAVNGLDSDVQGLQTAVQAKADTSTVTALSGTVSGLSDTTQQYMEYTNSAITDLQDNKASKSYVDGELATKANVQTVTALSGTVTDLQANKADKTYVDTELAGKASTAVVTTSTNGLMSAQDKSKLDEVGLLKEQIYNSYPNVEAETASVVSITDGADDIPVKSLVVGVEPVQDLHGYDSPWPAGGGVNKADLTGATAYNDGTYGMYVTVDGEEITLAGTWTNSNATGIWRFLSVPNIPSDLNVVAFENTSGNHVKDVRQDGTNNRLIITATNMVNGQAYTIKFKIVAYEGSTAPTEWTPYSNICPISGWTGAQITGTGHNLWDEQWELGAYSGTTGEKVENTTNIRCKNRISVRPNTAYYSKSPNAMYVFEYDASGVYLGYTTVLNGSITTKPTTHYMRFYLLATYGTTYNHDIGINYPSTDTDYHAYSGSAYFISWQSEAGTVYGGTLDVTTGVLTVDRAAVDLGTLTWNASTRETTYKIFFTYGIAQLIKDTVNNWTIPLNFICSQYKTVTFNEAYAGNTNGVISFAKGNHSINLVDSNFADYSVTEVATALSGVQLVYKLATPITYQLTPQEVSTLLGQNNIWADTGDTSLAYRADTKLYVDGICADCNSMLAPVESTYIATRNYTTGQLLIVDNTLYKVTANIANGGTITAGTNVVATTLSEVIASLS